MVYLPDIPVIEMISKLNTRDGVRVYDVDTSSGQFKLARGGPIARN